MEYFTYTMGLHMVINLTVFTVWIAFASLFKWMFSLCGLIVLFGHNNSESTPLYKASSLTYQVAVVPLINYFQLASENLSVIL